MSFKPFLSSADPSPDTSIVVATCSRAALLCGAVESLFAQTWARSHPIELIVVDDGSTDDTAHQLAQLAQIAPFPLHLVQGPARGIAAARNAGFAVARGRWIASFDDDQLASPHWLQALRQRAELANASIIGGALILDLPLSARPGPRTRALLGEHLPYRVAQRYRAPLHPATANALLRRDLLANAGGFDPDFTEGGEDKDLFQRLSAAGHPIWFEPAATAKHLISTARIADANLRWTARRIGASDARCTLRQGLSPTLSHVGLRCASVLARDLPLRVLGNARLREDARCGLWYSEGLLRGLWALQRPRSSGSAAFLHSLNFRHRNGERAEAAPR